MGGINFYYRGSRGGTVSFKSHLIYFFSFFFFTRIAFKLLFVSYGGNDFY